MVLVRRVIDMTKLTNRTKIPLPAAVWIASNTYDFKPNPKALSATDFTKSIRQLVLRNRLTENDIRQVDIASLIKSKIGTAIHDAIESTWLNESLRDKALEELGVNSNVIKNIVVNTPLDELKDSDIPVYMEIRDSIEIGGYTISGKFDFVVDGALCDFKTTGTWKWGKLGDADRDYQIQGSIYKLIHKDIISKDKLHIIFIFTDFVQGKAFGDKYPPAQCVDHVVPLLNELETFDLITGVIEQLEMYKDALEIDLPECTSEQLWQSPPTYKYYKNPAKTSRATKNSTNYYEVEEQFRRDGSIGVIKTIHSEVRACHTCNVANLCSQRTRLIEAGLLKV